MRFWLRLLIVCLMALALPVQGQAVAVMQHCGTGAGDSASRDGMRSQPTGHAAHADRAAHAGHGDHAAPAGHEGHAGHRDHDASAPHGPHAAHTTHDAGERHAAHDAAMAEPGGAAAPDHPGGTAGGHGCSACASCCAAIGFPAAALPMPISRAAVERPALAPTSAASFLTTGPERPPRTIL